LTQVITLPHGVYGSRNFTSDIEFWISQDFLGSVTPARDRPIDMKEILSFELI